MINKDINEIISNALIVKNDNLKNIKEIITQIKIVLENNKDMLMQASQIDNKKQNGFIFDFDVIPRIFKNIEDENIFYGDNIIIQKDDQKKLLYGKQIFDIGNVVLITDGNPYVTIEMFIRNIMAGNKTIIVNNGFMYGTNELILQIIQSVLEQFNISKYMVQFYVTENYDEVLNNFANIDLVVCIGSHNLQMNILNKSKNKTIISGYENFDLYIEDNSHIDFINKIISLGINTQIYVNKNLNIDYDNAIIVDDIEEAIAQINYNGSKYSSAIFTNSSKNASLFIKEVKSSIVTVNASPSIERIIDIKQKDLINEKTIIYPVDYKLDSRINFKQES